MDTGDGGVSRSLFGKEEENDSDDDDPKAFSRIIPVDDDDDDDDDDITDMTQLSENDREQSRTQKGYNDWLVN